MSSPTFSILKFKPYLVAFLIGKFNHNQDEAHMYTGIVSISLTK